MQCPECQNYMNDSTPTCTVCSFNICEFDKVLNTPTERISAVIDWAGILSIDTLTNLEQRLKSFTETTGFDFCMVTIDSSAPRSPREFVFWLFNRWKIGGDDHLGLLVLLSVQERRIEVEMGHNLEKYLTDDEAAGVLQHHAVPFFKKNDFDNGLLYSLDILSKIIEHVAAEEKKNDKTTES